ncbi:MAG: hypothetical protein MUO82_07555 [Candidatus Thermoplasmatota archaeon]|nr:hypothetical protein [Candidatus Thermoplasmatota archaeon]
MTFIEYWGYISTIGIFITGFGAGLHWLLQYDDKYKKILDDNEGTIKTNYFIEWFNNIELKIKGKKQVSDETINAELRNLFNIVNLFQTCRILDEKNKGSVKYIQITIMIAGIFVALLPITDLLPIEISVFYFAGLISNIIFIIISIYYKTKLCEKLEEKVENLMGFISFKIPVDSSEGDNNS